MLYLFHADSRLNIAAKVAEAQALAPEAPYLKGLNAEQREAVVRLDGPVLVLAGAGTGKTRVLTTRIAHLLCTKRAQRNEILAVTFTNKAAREMKERVGALVGGAVEGMPWLGTFHSIGMRILRRHAELAGLSHNFTILDVDDQVRLVKQLIQAEKLDEKRWPARQLAGLIDGWKNKGLTPDKVPASDAFSFANGRGIELYAAYQKRLKELNAADFGDLLLENLRLFRENPDVLRQYHRWFPYIMVDEYQDTNVAQYLWLRLLAQGSKNICCVGDDDESIYGWRGAGVGQHPALREGFPRRACDPAGAQLPLDRPYPRRRLKTDREQCWSPRQDLSHTGTATAASSWCGASGTTTRKRGSPPRTWMKISSPGGDGDRSHSSERDP